MATNRDFGNMLNQKAATKGIQKKPERKSPWLKMGKGQDKKIAEEKDVPKFPARKKKRAFQASADPRRAMGIRNSSY